MGDYHQITLNEWAEWKKRLRQELNNVRTAFVRVGYVLRKIDETEAYKVEGYKSVAEFAEKEHGLKPSTTSRWMAINREFSVGGYSEQLDERYLNMNASQLTEMLGLPSEDRELITPETSRAEIRELRRFNRESESSGNGADVSPMYGAFADFLDKNPDVSEKVIECLRSGNADSEHIAEAVAPSGSKMFRTGTKFITFQKSDIKVKVFGGTGNSTVSWDEFRSAASEWFESHRRQEAEGEENVSRYDYRGSDGDINGRTEGETQGEHGRDSESTVRNSGFNRENGEKEDEETEGRGSESRDAEIPEREGTEETVYETGDPVSIGENDPEETVRGVQTDTADQAEEEESADRELRDDFNAPESVENVDKPEVEEIAPAQFVNKKDEDGDSSPEEEMTLSGKISQARMEVRFCMREIVSKIDFKKWEDAYDAAVELLSYLEFLKDNDTENA